MRNKIIKIGLIAVVLIGIATAIIMAVKTIADGDDEVIAVTPFEKDIEAQVNASIKDKNYAEAQKAYAAIMGTINTEASITRGDGTKNLSDAEVKKVKQMAFYAYAPIFAEYGTEYFSHSSWDKAVLNNLKGEAQQLHATGFAENGTDVAKKLSSISATIDEYYAAWAAANSAKSCTTVSGIAAVKTKANSYMHAPLTNNASLKSALQSAESVAKQNVANGIAGQCQKVARGYAHYGSYDNFRNAYKSALARINEYINHYGSTNQLSAARSQLTQADNNAIDYYSSYE